MTVSCLTAMFTTTATLQAYDRWKWDGFPSLSLASRRYLHRTITCSQHLKDFMIERGYPADRIGVVKLGINTTEFDVIQEEDRQRVKSMLNVSSDTIIVATTARLEAQKRSWLLPVRLFCVPACMHIP